MHNNTTLLARLRKAGRRLLLIGSARAIVWGLAAAVGLLVFAMWLDLVWELSSIARVVADCAAASAAVILAVVAVVATVRSTSFATLARRLDIAAQSPGEILTGWELGVESRESRVRPHADSQLSALNSPLAERSDQNKLPLTVALSRREKGQITTGLATLATQRAATLARGASLAKAVPARPLGRALAVLAGQATVIALLALVMPKLARTEWNRFLLPMADVPPYSSLHFVVSPGDTSVLYGEDLEIACTVEGGSADRAELVLVAANGTQTNLPMFSESNGSWRAVLSKLTEPAVYFIRSYRARSEKYAIKIITVPRIDSVRIAVVPPDYAGQPPYEGPVPDDGVKGLRGTRVTVWATSNRPLSGGNLVVWHGAGSREHGANLPAPSSLLPAPCSMRPTEPGSQEAVGQFEITGDGRFEFHLIDSDGQPSQHAFAANVTLLKDQYPLVRIIKPPPQSLATPTAVLPVLLSAEDDCGVARLELYRNLNRSRPLPTAVRLPPKPPHRHDEEVRLRLGDYGLEPGDELAFFARVEDNDPAGGKGSESQVVRVKIISQEEFEHMLRVRQGIESLASKYRQAQRRMEALAKETEGLRKKLHDAPPKSRVADETRKELNRLQRLMRRHAAEMRASAAHRLPLDIDSKLSPEIENAAAMTEQMAAELEKLEKQLDLLNGDLEKKLDELAKKLAAGRQGYASSAMEPIELLEVVFPLLVDQQRFVVLALRQEDLAQRMAALRGHDNEDDPALKTRMRDLEHEQRLIREELERLLGDIEDHAARLPEKPELKKLRETAQKFVKDVRASGAAEALGASEAALADFAGTRAHDKAKEASEILNRFVKRCQGEGEMSADCHGALVFQPKLAQCLGNTIPQMLAEMGLGAGSGSAPGRGTMGLYGDAAGMSGSGSGEFGEPHEGPSGGGEESGRTPSGGGNPDTMAAEEALANGAASAASEAGVPLRYRHAVRQYFQRLSEELGDHLPARETGAQHP